MQKAAHAGTGTASETLLLDPPSVTGSSRPSCSARSATLAPSPCPAATPRGSSSPCTSAPSRTPPSSPKRCQPGSLWFGVSPVAEHVAAPLRGTAADVVALHTLHADLDVAEAGGLPSWDAARAVVSDLSDLLGVGPSAVGQLRSRPPALLDAGRAHPDRRHQPPRGGRTAAPLGSPRRDGRRAARRPHRQRVRPVARDARPGDDQHRARARARRAGRLREAPSSTSTGCASALDEYGVPEVAEDAPGDVVAPSGAWAYAPRTLLPLQRAPWSTGGRLTPHRPGTRGSCRRRRAWPARTAAGCLTESGAPRRAGRPGCAVPVPVRPRGRQAAR